MADDLKLPQTAQVEAKPKAERWWQWILWGLLCIAVAIFLYYDLTNFEREGGTRRMNSILVIVYKIAGKWGVVGLMGLFGLGFLSLGVYQKASDKS